MARLFAATGDAIVRLEETDGAWVATRSLEESGAQCLAVDPHTPDTVFAGLREGGVRRSDDGGATWVDCALPEQGVFSLAVSTADGAVYAGTEPSRLFASHDRGRRGRRSTRCSSCRHGRPGASRRGPGRRTSAGSRRARTTRACFSSGSSWAG